MDSPRNAFSARSGFFPLEPVSAVACRAKARHGPCTYHFAVKSRLRGILLTIGAVALLAAAAGRAQFPTEPTVDPIQRQEQARKLAIQMLADALRDAERQHLRNATPLSAPMREALQPFFAERILDRARIAVGDVEPTLPALINAVAGEILRAEGDRNGGHAVTVGRVMVFSRMPGMDEIDWIGHEVKHVEQYNALGFEGFSERYLSHANEVESEARMVEARIREQMRAQRDH